MVTFDPLSKLFFLYIFTVAPSEDPTLAPSTIVHDSESLDLSSAKSVGISLSGLSFSSLISRWRSSGRVEKFDDLETKDDVGGSEVRVVLKEDDVFDVGFVLLVEERMDKLRHKSDLVLLEGAIFNLRRSILTVKKNFTVALDNNDESQLHKA